MVATTDRERRELHALLVQHMGDDVADALIDQLPPVGWGDLATKADLGGLGSDLRAEIAKLGGELRREMSANTRVIMFGVAAMIGSVSAAFGVALALTH